VEVTETKTEQPAIELDDFGKLALQKYEDSVEAYNKKVEAAKAVSSREEFAQGRRGPGGPRMRGPGGPGGPGPMADRGPDGPPPPGGPGMRRFRHGGPGMGIRMGARLFGEAGFVTAAQFRARALERFDRADANHDGTLTVAERQAQRGEMRRHRRMGPPPGGPDMPPPSPQPAQ